MPVIRINPDDLTIDEIEELDDLLEGGFSSMTNGRIPVKAMRVIAYLVMRRTEPDFTLEDAGKLKMSDFDMDDDPGEDGAAPT